MDKVLKEKGKKVKTKRSEGKESGEISEENFPCYSSYIN